MEAHHQCLYLFIPLCDKMIVEKLKRINKILMNFSNYFLCSIVYGFGVSVSFILFKLKMRKEKESNTYWVIPKEEEENYERQF